MRRRIVETTTAQWRGSDLFRSIACLGVFASLAISQGAHAQITSLSNPSILERALEDPESKGKTLSPPIVSSKRR